MLKEVLRKFGIVDALDDTIEAFRRVKEALTEYLTELQKIDIERFNAETAAFQQFESSLITTSDEGELNALILRTFDELGINKPWEGDFDDFMSDKSNKLKFD